VRRRQHLVRARDRRPGRDGARVPRGQASGDVSHGRRRTDRGSHRIRDRHGSDPRRGTHDPASRSLGMGGEDRAGADRSRSRTRALVSVRGPRQSRRDRARADDERHCGVMDPGAACRGARHGGDHGLARESTAERREDRAHVRASRHGADPRRRRAFLHGERGDLRPARVSRPRSSTRQRSSSMHCDDSHGRRPVRARPRSALAPRGFDRCRARGAALSRVRAFEESRAPATRVPDHGHPPRELEEPRRIER
jgi:hypothetical protein